MSPAELVAHCRTTREGKPEGDIRSPAVVADVISMLLEDRMRELANRARPPSGGIQDTRTGRIVLTEPAVPAQDPRSDSMACGLATLISYLEDAA